MKMIMEIFGRFKKNQKVETPEVFDSNHPDWRDFQEMVVNAKSDIVLKGLKGEGEGEGLDPYRVQLVDQMMYALLYEDEKDLKRSLKLIINMVRRLIKHMEGQKITDPTDLAMGGLTGGSQGDKARDFASQIFEPRPQDAADDES